MISAIVFLVRDCANRYPKMSEKWRILEKIAENLKISLKKFAYIKKKYYLCIKFLLYMKNKLEYIKLVYKRIPFKGGFWFDPDHSLGRDFPAFARLLAEFGWIKLDFEDCTRKGVCYIDKYGNVIVRYILKNVQQIKIDF